MITKPRLKPLRGYVEVEHDGKRMYRSIKTGEIVDPAEARPMYNETVSENEILNALLGVNDGEE